MKLGIIGAMDVEIAMLRKKMSELRTTGYAGGDYYEGRLEGLDVVVCRCGVGKVNAALCVQILRDRFSVTHVLNTGIAGALDDTLHVCDLVVSSDAMYHDVDATGFGYAFGQVPGMEQIQFSADETLIQYAVAAAETVSPGHVRIGRIASGDQFVSKRAMKDRIIASTGGLCTEMEGAAIAQACVKNELPFVILRAISDAADESVSWEYFEETAAEHCAGVVQAVAQKIYESTDPGL